MNSNRLTLDDGDIAHTPPWEGEEEEVEW